MNENWRYKHGMIGTPIYKCWEAMKNRCLNKKNKAYSDYGARGITVCDKWLNFIGFYEDMGSTYLKGLSIERIDNDKGYSKENCKWITLSEQTRNKRRVKLYEYEGEKLTTTELAKVVGINRDTLFKRLNKFGWNLEQSIGLKPYGMRVIQAQKRNEKL